MQTIIELEQFTENISDKFFYTWNEAYNDKQSEWWRNHSFVETDSARASKFQLLIDAPTPEEFIEGEAPDRYWDLMGIQIRVPMRRWRLGIQVSALDEIGDKLGMISREVASMAAKLAYTGKQTALEVLRLGDTSAYTLFDGVPLFDNNHPKGGTTFDNLGSGALDANTLIAAYEAMVEFPSDAEGIPLALLPTTLVVAPKMYRKARELLFSTINPETNTLYENQLQKVTTITDVVMDPLLTDPDDWYMISNQSYVRPFVILQHSRYGNPTINAEVGDDTEAFRKHMMRRWTSLIIHTVYPTKPEFFYKTLA